MIVSFDNFCRASWVASGSDSQEEGYPINSYNLSASAGWRVKMGILESYPHFDVEPQDDGEQWNYNPVTKEPT